MNQQDRMDQARLKWTKKDEEVLAKARIVVRNYRSGIVIRIVVAVLFLFMGFMLMHHIGNDPERATATSIESQIPYGVGCFWIGLFVTSSIFTSTTHFRRARLLLRMFGRLKELGEFFDENKE